nr:hypothetical protein Iba_chr01fCG8220 [Ipomoea batatas]
MKHNPIWYQCRSNQKSIEVDNTTDFCCNFLHPHDVPSRYPRETSSTSNPIIFLRMESSRAYNLATQLPLKNQQRNPKNHPLWKCGLQWCRNARKYSSVELCLNYCIPDALANASHRRSPKEATAAASFSSSSSSQGPLRNVSSSIAIQTQEY